MQKRLSISILQPSSRHDFSRDPEVLYQELFFIQMSKIRLYLMNENLSHNDDVLGGGIAVGTTQRQVLDAAQRRG